MLQKIILAPFRGFCAGVDRAIFAVEECLQRFGTVYVYHQIVHNTHVVKDLEKKGAVFVESVEDVPSGSYLVFSAHGVSPQVKSSAGNFKLLPIDATCPLVTKVHIEAQDFYRRGFTIVLIGHKNHQETLGTMGYAPMTLVQTVDDVDKLHINNANIANIGATGNNRTTAYITWNAGDVATSSNNFKVGQTINLTNSNVTGAVTLAAINSATNVTISCPDQTVTANTTGRIQVTETFNAKRISNKYVWDWTDRKWRYYLGAPYTDGSSTISTQPAWQGVNLVRVDNA